MADRTVIGLFTKRPRAEEAVRALQERGVDENRISIVSRDENQENGEGGAEGRQQMTNQREGDEQEVADGATWGGAVGAGAGLLASAGALAIPGIGPVLAAGPLAATLSGAVTGGMAGGLVDWGIPEERGRHYEERVKAGRVLVAVQASQDQIDEAEKTLREHGAEEVEAH